MKSRILVFVIFSVVLIFTACQRISIKSSPSGESPGLNDSSPSSMPKDSGTSSSTPICIPSVEPNGIDTPSPESIPVPTPAPAPTTIIAPDLGKNDSGSVSKGNSSGNIANNGYVTMDSRYIYFLHANQMVYDDDFRLYKEDIITGEFSKVTDDYPIKMLNAYDGWVYYSKVTYGDKADDTGIYRVKADGTQTEKIMDKAGSFIIYNNHIFVGGFEATLDGKSIIKLIDKSFESNITNEWIYFNRWDSDNANNDNGFYKCRRDGTEESLIIYVSARNMLVDNGWIYYINLDDNSTLYRVDINGGNNKKLLDKSLESINIYNDYIIYNKAFNEGLGKIKNDGTGDTDLYNVPSIATFSINIVDDWVYFYKGGAEQPMNQYRISIDGTRMKGIVVPGENEN